jgi:hypothetical protein
MGYYVIYIKSNTDSHVLVYIGVVFSDNIYLFIYRFLSDSIHNLAEIAVGARLPDLLECMWQVSLSLTTIILGTCKIFSVFFVLID